MTKKDTAVRERGKAEPGQIVIHPLAKTPEPFLEEINTVRLEGRYFAFDPKRANEKQTRQEFRDGERTLEIIVHPEYGRSPFSDREIGRLIGRDVFGGKDVREIEHAIKQLKSTEVIETTSSEKSNKTRKISYSFPIIPPCFKLFNERSEFVCSRCCRKKPLPPYMIYKIK